MAQTTYVLILQNLKFEKEPLKVYNLNITFDDINGTTTCSYSNGRHYAKIATFDICLSSFEGRTTVKGKQPISKVSVLSVMLHGYQ